MKDFEIIKKLIGYDIKEQSFKNIDCYVIDKLGLFIPSMDVVDLGDRDISVSNSYVITIDFSADNEDSVRADQYSAYITSPYKSIPNMNYKDCYFILIDKAYFQSQAQLYGMDIAEYNNFHFPMCHDILKTLNNFAFEYSKSMMNSDITLDAQATVITHWLIRSVIGDTLDLRAISPNYNVARVQHYMERNYADNIKIIDLAELIGMSVSSFNRLFKKEIGMTPFEYLIELRVNKSKVMLRRKENTVTDVALRCGFSSSAHYSAVFTKLTGTTPTEYRGIYK